MIVPILSRNPLVPPNTPFERPRRQIEREFGVPVPGEILAPERWTQTALKKLPPPSPLDFAGIFGRTAPVMLDIGCGNGRSTLASCVWRPAVDHLSSDVLPVVIRYATRRANQRGLTNVRFAVIGGRELLADYIAPQSVAEIHVYHPQPFYESNQVHRRLITPEFLALVHRSLAPGGLFVLQTALFSVGRTSRALARCPERADASRDYRVASIATCLSWQRPPAYRCLAGCRPGIGGLIAPSHIRCRP
jgi:SAM-dependent methyltransferase